MTHCIPHPLLLFPLHGIDIYAKYLLVTTWQRQNILPMTLLSGRQHVCAEVYRLTSVCFSFKSELTKLLAHTNLICVARHNSLKESLENVANHVQQKS